MITTNFDVAFVQNLCCLTFVIKKDKLGVAKSENKYNIYLQQCQKVILRKLFVQILRLTPQKSDCLKKKNKRLILVYIVNYFISPVSHWRHLHRILCLNIDIASFYGHSRVHKLIPVFAPFRAKNLLWIFSSLRVSPFQKSMNQLSESDQNGTKRGQHQNEF